MQIKTPPTLLPLVLQGHKVPHKNPWSTSKAFNGVETFFGRPGPLRKSQFVTQKGTNPNRSTQRSTVHYNIFALLSRYNQALQEGPSYINFWTILACIWTVLSVEIIGNFLNNLLTRNRIPKYLNAKSINHTASYIQTVLIGISQSKEHM